jgi:uncharacterized membrane protein
MSPDHTTDKVIRGQESRVRLETFSDGVFAIILTLLVLELTVPEIQSGSSFSEYALRLEPLIPKFVSFALSFCVIAIYWVNHRNFFLKIAHCNDGLVWNNMHALFWLCFIPFPTALLGLHPYDTFPVLLYGVTLLMPAITFYVMTVYAKRKGLYRSDLSSEHVREYIKHTSYGYKLYLVGIAASFLSIYISWIIYLLPCVFYFLPKKPET